MNIDKAIQALRRLPAEQFLNTGVVWPTRSVDLYQTGSAPAFNESQVIQYGTFVTFAGWLAVCDEFIVDGGAYTDRVGNPSELLPRYRRYLGVTALSKWVGVQCFLLRVMLAPEHAECMHHPVYGKPTEDVTVEDVIRVFQTIQRGEPVVVYGDDFHEADHA